jgi:hypothetical protein
MKKSPLVLSREFWDVMVLGLLAEGTEIMGAIYCVNNTKEEREAWEEKPPLTYKVQTVLVLHKKPYNLGL